MIEEKAVQPNRGGRRSGAGRKAPLGKTVTLRVPVAIRPQVEALIDEHRANLSRARANEILYGRQ